MSAHPSGAFARFALMALAALLACLTLAPSARAAAPVFNTAWTCSTFTPCGTITTGFAARRMAVDESSGSLYVLDVANDAVVVFTSSGAYQSTILGSSTTRGSFGFGAGENDIAVDNSGGANQGRVYVISEAASGSPDHVGAFAFDNAANANAFLWQSTTGAPFIDTCGIGVNPVNGTPYAVDYNSGVRPLNPADGTSAGAALYNNPSSGECEIEFDSRGNSYIRIYNSGEIRRYSAGGSFLGTLDNSPDNLDEAVDLSNDDVYLSRPGDVAVYDSSGAPVSGTPFGAGLNAYGVAVNAAAHKVYVSGSDSGFDIVAMFDIPTHNLDVTVDGSGSGRVDGASGSVNADLIVNCTSSGGACSGTYDDRSAITLTATPAAHTAVRWSDNTCSGNRCVVTLDADKAVTATFETIQRRLTVSKAGAGSGTVTSSPPGIDCGATCSASFDESTLVTLTAAPAAGSTFTGWSGGGCSGTGDCRVTLSSDRTVTATFARIQHTVTAAKAGTGSGSVSSSPAGIDCGATCSALFDEGTSVTLTATPAAGSTFTGWSGAGCSGTGTCTVTANADATATATFALNATPPPPPPPNNAFGQCVAKANKAFNKAKKAAKKKHGKARAKALKVAKKKKAKAVAACKAKYA
jgi:hypothetical protein